MSKYETHIDLNADTSHAQMVDLVGHNKRVLDVGCADGSMARVLVERGCTVSGVELDEEAAERARGVLETTVVGDLERLDLSAEFAQASFDVVVFGDVLEHLRDPLRSLRQAKELLAPGGSVVISVPNVAHGAVRLALLKGAWDYTRVGLLDETHLRFFTRDSLGALLDRAGFAMTDLRRTTAGIFETELELDRNDFPPELVDEILRDPEATTYQFVVRAIVDDAEHAVSEIARREHELQERVILQGREIDRLQGVEEQLETAIAHSRSLQRRILELEEHIRAIQATKIMRLTRRPRALYLRLRGRG
jgi:2-polyprenyl-3-methyl-5-hydroxy-6-metoxy-1,4-benzoquinol methylase